MSEETGRKVMLITGGSQGIGAAVARMAGTRGYDVAVSYQSNRALAEAVAGDVRAAGGRAIAVQAEMGDEAAILALFAAVDDAFGRLDVLVNNAGGPGPTCRIEAVTAAIVDDVMRVNVRAPFLTTREAAARMRTDRGGHGGSIVNISSRAADIGGAGEWVHYAASKGALNSLTFGAARELAPLGIRMNAVSPGLIETELHARAGLPDRLNKMVGGVPMGRTGSAEEVADVVLWLASDAASYVTGIVVPVSGGR